MTQCRPRGRTRATANSSLSRGLEAGEVAEIAAMRVRMEREIGAETTHRLNLKQGRGGLVDVEFITQMMALRHGHAYPRCACAGPSR